MPDAARIVFGRELRAGLRPWLCWVVLVGLLLTLTCALQPSLAGGTLAAKIESLPATLRKALGLQLVDFHRPAAYLTMNFTIVALATAVFPALFGASLIAKEELLRTAETLYAQPCSRTRILVGKTGALIVYAIALPVGLAAIAMAVLGAVSDRPLEPGVIGALFGGAIAVAVCFAGAGMLAAALVRDKRHAAGAAFAVVLSTYFLGVISAISETAAPLRWLSPHKLAEPVTILTHGLDPLRVVALVVAGGVMAVLAIVRYRDQDIHA